VAAIETTNDDVTCNALCPGWVLTPLVHRQIEGRATAEGIPVEQAREDLLREKQPTLNFKTLEQLGGLVKFCAAKRPRREPAPLYSLMAAGSRNNAIEGSNTDRNAGNRRIPNGSNRDINSELGPASM
jgi:NAD(P)-dependent dehydrogenase (short-subunit alcohol dehydrogenase family)